MYKCKYCGRIAKSKLSNVCHEKFCNLNPNCSDKTHLKQNGKNTCIKIKEKRQLYKQIISKEIIIKNCENCGKDHDGSYGSGRFCSKECARSFSTKNSQNKFKEAKCIKCGKDIMIPLRASTKTCNCKDCKQIIIKQHKVKNKKEKQHKEKIKKEKKYKEGIKTSFNINGKQFTRILTPETIEKFREAGKKSASKQAEIRRSKAEKLFCELCENQFKEVKHNEPIFNGWDADVIIEDFKIAVLWNGPCHYEPIFGKANLNRTQNRDKIKHKEIINAGYVPYIIKDLNKYKEEFVKEKFDEFLKYLNDNNYIII